MSGTRDTEPERQPAFDPSSDPEESISEAPLVIVSEQGRHNEASRRVVRAQAARASAAASRITRARNRQEREAREETAQSLRTSEAPTSSQSQPGRQDLTTSQAATALPLIAWMGTIPAFSNMTPSVGGLGPNNPSQTSSPSSSNVGLSSDISSWMSSSSRLQDDSLEPGIRRLPLALPRGFVELNKRINLPDSFTSLLSQTACFDFGSPGVEQRLHQLLLDLLLSSTTMSLSLTGVSAHRVVGHLRIACTCLTIFQGQRADGQLFAHDPKYNAGLQAAWSEVILLDRDALSEPKTAQASLWAVFVISVTTGSGAAAEFFHQLLHSLLQDLNLHLWDQVRRTLLDFIYPVSFLDEPCKLFFQRLQSLRIGSE